MCLKCLFAVSMQIFMELTIINKMLIPRPLFSSSHFVIYSFYSVLVIGKNYTKVTEENAILNYA